MVPASERNSTDLLVQVQGLSQLCPERRQGSRRYLVPSWIR